MRPEHIQLRVALSIVHGAPLATVPEAVNVLRWLLQRPLRRSQLPSALVLGREALLAQHSWLCVPTLPWAALRARDIPYAWAWMDTQELRYGPTLLVHPQPIGKSALHSKDLDEDSE